MYALARPLRVAAPSAPTPPDRRHEPGVAGRAGQARGTPAGSGRPAAREPARELSDAAEAPVPPGSAVDGGLGRPVARLGDLRLAGRRRGSACLLQPDPEDGQRAGWSRRNRSVDHDGGTVPGGRVSAPDCAGPYWPRG